MPIFSLFIIAYIIYFFVNNKTSKDNFKDLFFVTCFLSVNLFQGYMISIAGSELNRNAICINIIFFYSAYIVLARKVELPTKPTLAAVIFISMITLSMMNEMLFPYDGLLLPMDAPKGWDGYVAGEYSKEYIYPDNTFYLKQFKNILSYALIIILAKKLLTWNDYIEISMRIIKWSKPAIYFGFIEFYVKNVMGNLDVTFWFTEIIFGVSEESTLVEAIKKGGDFYILQGFTKEASHYIIFLFTIVVLMLLLNVIYKLQPQMMKDIPKTYSKTTTISALILIMITGGFSAVWMLLVLFLIFLLLKLREKRTNIFKAVIKQKKSVVFVGIVFLILLCFISNNEYFMGRLYDAIFVMDMLMENSAILMIGNEGIGSTIARFTSIIDNFYVFIERPILGLSFNLQWAHDTTIEWLAGIGIAGCISLYYLWISSDCKKSYDNILLIIFIIAGLPMKIMMPATAFQILIFIELSALYMKFQE